DAAPPSATQTPPPAEAGRLGAPATGAAGNRSFVSVRGESKASYHASEEFFPAALAKLGIDAGRAEAVGTTQAITGRFELDPERPTAPPGENAFTVRVNTLTSNQQKRDDYLRQIRDDGPSFDKYPLAIFKANRIDGSSVAGASGRELNLQLTGDLTIR